MKLGLLAFVMTAVPSFLLGCNTRVDDCNKVIGVHNAGVEEQKKVDADKPEGLAALATLNDKTATSMAAVPVKDEGLKTKTSALVDAEKALSVQVRVTVSEMKELKELTDKPMPDDVDSIKKRASDLEALTMKMEKSKPAMDSATAVKKKASDDFDAYCK